MKNVIGSHPIGSLEVLKRSISLGGDFSKEKDSKKGPVMLTQEKINAICALIEKSRKRKYRNGRSITAVYRDIADELECSQRTVWNLANERRHKRGSVHKHVKQQRDCPKCGPHTGSYCVRCSATNKAKKPINGSDDGLAEGPGPSENDPSPEVIAMRARALRMKKADHKRRGKRINYKDPEIALWVGQEAAPKADLIV